MKKLWLVLTVALLFYTMTAWGGEEETPFGYFVKVPCTGRYVFVAAETCQVPAQTPNQVTAYKASDGVLFETREEVERYEKTQKLYNLLHGVGWVWKESLSADKSWEKMCLSDAEFIVNYWPEIKAIMEGEK